MSYLLALSANFCFAFATIIFYEFAKKVSIRWINFLKALVALVLFGITAFAFSESFLPNPVAFTCFFVSGLIGLCIGDLFLIKAFTIIGPGRSLVLFGMHPFLLGVMSYLIFGQKLAGNQLWGILLLIACLLIFLFERYTFEKKWNLAGFSDALIAVLFDAAGIILTRYAFDNDPNQTAFHGNFYRCLGAVFGFLIISWFWNPIHLVRKFANLTTKHKLLALTGCVFGTFLSLGLYLKAIQIGHLATLSAITITAPVFASLFEALHKKTWPSKYLLGSLVLFAIGFYLIFSFEG